MSEVSLAEAKARLSELVARAAEGDTVCITKRGKPVAKLTAAGSPRKPIDVEAMRRLTDSTREQKEPASKFVRRMRDEDRY